MSSNFTVLAVSALVGGGAILAAPVVLSAAGFTAAGIGAGSLAAGVQASVYGGATSGVISVFQSAGMAGLSVAGKAVIGTAGSAATYYLFK
nr:interferon alpha-inducible protein 27-like protein 2B [Lepeophtheirus salmonis]